MPARDGDLGLSILDRAGSSTKGNPQPQEACFQLETGKLEQLGCFPEVNPLVEVVAQHLGFEKIAGAVSASAGGAQGERSQEPVVESIEKDDALLPFTRNDGELSLLHPIEDFSGPLGQVGRGDDGSRH